MMKTLKRIAAPLLIVGLIGFVLFMVNQVSGIYLMMASWNHLAANVFLVVISAVLLVLTLWPFLLYAKLPVPLKLPSNEEELVAYRQKLLARLKKNKVLKQQGAIPTTEADMDQALRVLEVEAGKVVKDTATAVFLTTSISQNGKLDALTILATQSRMVWKVAHIYYQRPTLRELAYLYGNVAASSFLASQIEDINITQQVEPVLNSFLKNGASKSIPVIGPTAHIILDSLLEGSTNAFLTLRVGNITKKYCGCNAIATKRSIRRAAFFESAAELKGLVVKSSGEVIAALLKATRKAGVDTIKSSWEGVKNTGTKMADGIGGLGRRMSPFKSSVFFPLSITSESLPDVDRDESDLAR